ncbi:MCE family protein [Mycolicibacterium sp. ELW1]|uniref:MCE family protein n=1 Tax=Mycobacteriaceae TaxID=1762 RepID=UPI0011EBBD0D|nr:MCE family protein [Mycobacterium sp. ELW1]QEN16523.1 MCE family protein [Mycobacterium sp. ELW1]
MKISLGGVVWRLAVFGVVCVFAIVALFAVFAQLRVDTTANYNATFNNVSGLKIGDFVRVAGVEVGKVKNLVIQDDSTVHVEFSASSSVLLTAGTKVVVRYENLVGDRYLALLEGPGDVRRLQPGQTIPISNTLPALDLDALIGGLRPLFRALNPEQVNSLTGELIQALQGQGATIKSILAQTASLTDTLANRDQLIGQVIDNLNSVLGSLGDQSKQFDKAVDSVSQLVRGLAAHKDDISGALGNANAAAGTIADLLSQARPPLQETVRQLDRVASIVVSDHDYVDNLLNKLPDKYQLLARQGLYGDFFNFYLCDAVLKMNGKGGEPVYIKVAGQDTGRCAPK